MSYLLLNSSVSSEKYGHYIIYNSKTDSVSYEFHYKILPVDILKAYVNKLKSISGVTDMDVIYYAISGNEKYTTGKYSELLEYNNFKLTTKETMSEVCPWFPEVNYIETTLGNNNFAHFFATLGLLIKGYKNFGSWPKDLIDYSVELRMGTVTDFPDGSLSQDILYSDFDSIGVNKYYEDNLETALDNYFTDIYSKTLRINLVKDEYLDEDYDEIRTYMSYIISNDSYISSYKDSVANFNNTNLILAAGKMQNYIDSI